MGYFAARPWPILKSRSQAETEAVLWRTSNSEAAISVPIEWS